VGNLPTEVLLATLRRMGADLPELEPLEALIQRSAEIGKRYGQVVQ
jgi:hydroxymethylglutaryl-CoA lyase